MSLASIATCVTIPWGAGADTQKHALGCLANSVEAGPAVTVEVCKANFHTVVLLRPWEEKRSPFSRNLGGSAWWTFGVCSFLPVRQLFNGKTLGPSEPKCIIAEDRLAQQGVS